MRSRVTPARRRPSPRTDSSWGTGRCSSRATGRAGVVDSRTQTPHSLELIGMHGSLTPGEMLVPLLVVA